MEKIILGLVVFLSFFPVYTYAADFGDMVSPTRETITMTKVCTQAAFPRAQSQSPPGNSQWNNVSYVTAEDLAEADIDMHNPGHIKDVAARLLFPDGNLGVVDKSITTSWTAIPTYVSYGGDTWKTDLTAKEVNDPKFGFALQVGNSVLSSQFLRASDFGFRIPSDATITGITVGVKRREALSGGNPDTMVGYVNHIRMSVCYTTQSTENITGAALIMATVKAPTAMRIAPGEKLPIPVSFQSFGGSDSTDVSVQYHIQGADGTRIDDSQTLNISSNITPFESIQIPVGYNPGQYTITATVSYGDQTFSDVMKFQFVVEKKIAGFFVSQLVYMAGIFVFFVMFAVGVYYAYSRKKAPLDMYANIPESEKVYYEIIDDMISQMYDSIGDRAYKMADAIAGLVVDKKTGKILALRKDPSEIVSVLYIRYQNVFKKKLKIAQRAGSKKIEDAGTVEKNLDTLEKYFHKK